MLLGASLTVSDIGTGPDVIRDYAQTVEGLGYDYLLAADHVLGNNPAAAVEHGATIGVSSEHAGRMGTTALAFHDPLILFAFLACCTRRIGFASGVLILAQRQAALVAKQAASLDELSGGRFRLGIGVGWNKIEFEGLGADFHARGRLSEEQVRFMQALWANPHTTFHGEFHHLTDGGLVLRPKTGRIPIWFGGHAAATLRRVARYGDGYMPIDHAPGDDALALFARLRAMVREAGRKPEDVGIEVWVSPGRGGEADWRRDVAFWKAAGVTHLTAHLTFIGAHHGRVSGRTAAEHLAALTRFRAAVADLL
jgi:probable F420-dependent oxidoreductase